MGFIKNIRSDIGDRLSMYDLKGGVRFVSIYGTILVVLVGIALYGIMKAEEKAELPSYKYASSEVSRNEEVKGFVGDVRLLTLLTHRVDDDGEAANYVIGVQGTKDRGEVTVDVERAGEGWRIKSWSILIKGERHEL